MDLFSYIENTTSIPPACDYTEVNLRLPHDRSPRLPPKFASCKDDGGGGRSTSSAGADDPGGGTSPLPADMPLDLSGPYPTDKGRTLPERMEHMGWMFFYFNGLR